MLVFVWVCVDGDVDGGEDPGWIQEWGQFCAPLRQYLHLGLLSSSIAIFSKQSQSFIYISLGFVGREPSIWVRNKSTHVHLELDFLGLPQRSGLLGAQRKGKQ